MDDPPRVTLRVISLGGEIEFPLVDETYAIGRAPGSDIHIDVETVSGTPVSSDKVHATGSCKSAGRTRRCTRACRSKSGC